MRKSLVVVLALLLASRPAASQWNAALGGLVGGLNGYSQDQARRDARRADSLAADRYQERIASQRGAVLAAEGERRWRDSLSLSLYMSRARMVVRIVGDSLDLNGAVRDTALNVLWRRTLPVWQLDHLATNAQIGEALAPIAVSYRDSIDLFNIAVRRAFLRFTDSAKVKGALRDILATELTDPIWLLRGMTLHPTAEELRYAIDYPALLYLHNRKPQRPRKP